MRRSSVTTRLRPSAALQFALALGVTLLSGGWATTPATAQGDFFSRVVRRFSVGEPYALDELARRGETQCLPANALVVHRGGAVRWSGAVRVHPEFRVRVERFEALVSELAIKHYGRAPRRIVHAGSYVCRSVRGNAGRLSEHGLGNAVDVRGFTFGPMPRGATPPAELPRALRRSFDVTLLQHWSKTRGHAPLHDAFLRELVDRVARDDVFRVIYGPAHPGHRDHLHFDMSPFRWVHV